MSAESERPSCPNCGAIPLPPARGKTLAFCAGCDIAYSHYGVIVASSSALRLKDWGKDPGPKPGAK